jgi:hypothetical protein
VRDDLDVVVAGVLGQVEAQRAEPVLVGAGVFTVTTWARRRCRRGVEDGGARQGVRRGRDRQVRPRAAAATRAVTAVARREGADIWENLFRGRRPYR